jgi:hypothetical protein
VGWFAVETCLLLILCEELDCRGSQTQLFPRLRSKSFDFQLGLVVIPIYG